VNIATILEPEIEPVEGQNPATDTQETRHHNMKVSCLVSKIVIENADWVMTDEKGKALHSIPTFRVMLGADPEGVRLFVWKDGADFSGVPDHEERIAGWDNGQAAKVTRQNHYTYDARGDNDGKPGDLPERVVHIGDIREEDRGTEGGKAEGKTPFGRWLDHIRQEYRRVRGDVR
jgi:hypothetical protein